MFEVIPVVNCPDFECVKKRLAQIEQLGGELAHIDISDGAFAPSKTWANPKELKTDLGLEVHLMVQKPEEVIDGWLAIGVKRIIVHIETLDGADGERFHFILDRCLATGAEIMVAVSPETPIEDVLPYLDFVYFVQCLAVKPGPSGQEFDEATADKVRFLRERMPDVTIEVDGGINLENAKLVRKMGADIVTSATYIFGSRNPERAYKDLLEVDSLLREEEN